FSDAIAVLHPLLHSNNSDLSGPRYRSTFNGDELFVNEGPAGKHVLSPLSLLEMARAAVRQALPERPDSAVLELHDTAWAQPIVVDGATQVTIALFADAEESIDFEISTREGDQDVVHCQGRALVSRGTAPEPLPLQQLEREMTGSAEAPASRAITALRRGHEQLLARLQLPEEAKETAAAFILHPLLLDAALYAAAALQVTAPQSNPVELETLRVFAPCTEEMVAWVRRAETSHGGDSATLDIDLCDARGNVCVQLRGLTTGIQATAVTAAEAPRESVASLAAIPVWQPDDAAAALADDGAMHFVEHHVILCGLPRIDAGSVRSLLSASDCLSLQSSERENVAAQYSEYALACFERLKAIVQSKPRGKVLVQVAVADDEQTLLAGLAALFRSAALEDRQLTTQFVLVPADSTAEELGRALADEMRRGGNAVLRLRDGVRQVLRWQEVATADTVAPIAFKDEGVYLITGGLGGLGVLFAREIVQQARGARVILTGRAASSEQTRARLAAIGGPAGRIAYKQVDLEDARAVTQLVASIEAEYGRLDGILHSAGMTADNFIPKKTASEFAGVLAPKVTGTVHLDRATRHVDLDLFVLFSSAAAAMGNPGQSDYATANGFLDQFAAYRNRLVAAGERHGRTRAINWPLWEAGGMGLDAASRELLFQTTGMQPMPATIGMDFFHRSIASPHDQMLVVTGELPRMTSYLQKSGILERPAESESAPYQYANKAEEFYSDTTSRASTEFKEEYLTFAPFVEKVPGFSMSRVLLSPEEFPDEVAYVLAKQREMRQLLFCKEDFPSLTSVLDFGCGHGTDVIQIGSLFPHIQAHGCTITRDQAILGNQRIAGKGLDATRIRIYHKDSSQDAFPSRYDLVFGVEVSFHIRNKIGLFNNICTSLNDQGRILLADYVSNLPGSVDDPNVEISIPTKKEWARLTAQFGLEIDELIDVSPEIANFLFDPDLKNNIGKLPEVTQKTLTNYANQSASLERGWLSYVLIKMKRNDTLTQEQLEAHNLQKIEAATPYPAALQEMLQQPHVHYPPRDASSTVAASTIPVASARATRVTDRPAIAPVAASPSPKPDAGALTVEQLQQQLKAILAAVLRIDAAMIDADQPFSEFGLDSFLGVELIIAINKKYGTELSNIKVFDYPTVKELSLFLLQEIKALPGQATEPVVAAAPVTPQLRVASAPRKLQKRARVTRTAAGRPAASLEKIAIVGMSGRYPQAANLNEYWNNLAQGRDAIVEVPSSRWDVDRYYDADPTSKDKTNSKWLGLMDDIDRFDPLFFRISPQEAEYMDPQHRLFLQESYRAFEDAGYSPSSLSNRKCGVYLGISTNEYTSLLARNGVRSAPVTSNSYAIAAARIAYYLNLKGPAIAVDTACSSSLVAIHLASQAILSGEIDMAIAGGVSLWLTPDSYLAMSQAGMFSPTGRCKTFDDGADGIVVGEGVGAVVLKRLSDAEADGDFIHGVILGSGINQDGRTNGITAPSVNSQIELERSIYSRHGIDPETIGYVETHGTGTRLGDPIELEALATVFKEKTSRKNYCALGAVKSNIGHTTAAAGVAGVQKVLLSMRHKTLVPTLNVTKENSRFQFADSPFYVSRETKAWEVTAGHARRAAVSSFGFSGTNAHLVIEEYVAPERPSSRGGESPYIVPLSARTAEQLRQRARDLLDFLETAPEPVDLAAIAYTLQSGREAMEERLGFVAASPAELTAKLAAYVRGDRNTDGVHQGRADLANDGMTIIGRDEDMQEAIDKWIERRKLPKLLDLWVKGLTFDWGKLQGEPKPRRVPLPTYPFAKERYWIDEMSSGPMLEIKRELDVDMRSIEDIINRIGDDTMETAQAVTALKMLV
ncbi:MAG TPA: SDR family NAD(P)-dependent oxidoreductase, partial [Thermoanaerobaculia bacterium]